MGFPALITVAEPVGSEGFRSNEIVQLRGIREFNVSECGR